MGQGAKVPGVFTWLKKQKQLQSLRISHSSSNRTAGLLGSLPNLKKLEFRSCKQMEELPADVCSCHNLERLALVGCEKLTSLPANIGSLSGLRDLRLVDCRLLLGVPESIGALHLKHLKVLDCSPGFVAALPNHLQQLIKGPIYGLSF
jgi:Leucine-rich repeat (LRR) protein